MLHTPTLYCPTFLAFTVLVGLICASIGVLAATTGGGVLPKTVVLPSYTRVLLALSKLAEVMKVRSRGRVLPS